VRSHERPTAAAINELGHAWRHVNDDLTDGASAPEQAPRVLIIASVKPGLGRLATVLGERGIDVRQALLMRAKEALQQDSPRLVVLDVPDLHGAALVQCAGEVRDELRARKVEAPILVLADSISVETRIALMRAGVAAYVPLPADVSDVQARVFDLLSEPELDPFRVLIVDDDRAQTMIVEASLRRAGCKTRVVNEARLALAEMQEFTPDLAVVDLHMPEINGIELTRLIREQVSFAQMPVLFLSGEQDFAARIDAIRTGGDDFLIKPIQPQHLIAVVTSRARRARTLSALLRANPGEVDPGLYLDRLDFVRELERELKRQIAPEHPRRLLGGIKFALNESQFDGLSADEQTELKARAATILNLALATAPLTSFSELGFLALMRANSPAEALKVLEAATEEISEKLAERFEFMVSLKAQCVALELDASTPKGSAQLRQAEQALIKPGRAVFELPNDAPLPAAIVTRAMSLDEARLKVAQRFDVAELETKLARLQAGPRVLGEPEHRYLRVLWRPTDAPESVAEGQALRLALGDPASRNRFDRFALAMALKVLNYPQAQSYGWRLLVDQTLEFLRAPGSIRQITQDFERVGANPAQLVIAVSAEDLMTDPKTAKRVTEQLATLGIRMCLGNLGESLVSLKISEYVVTHYARLADRLLSAPNARASNNNGLRSAIEVAQKARLPLIFPRPLPGQSAIQAFDLGADWVVTDA
jgi:DNA-binding response OmpR family regulator